MGRGVSSLPCSLVLVVSKGDMADLIADNLLALPWSSRVGRRRQWRSVYISRILPYHPTVGRKRR
jgi:hypothetical protein